MPQIFYFFLKVILCSGILFGYYHLFLRNKVYHAYNRYYLLCAVMLSSTVPLLQFDIYNSKDETQLQPIQILEVVNSGDAYMEEIITTSHTRNLEVSDLLLTGYIAIALVFFVSFILILSRLYTLVRKSDKNYLNDIILVNSTAEGTPFSFFRYLFWNNQIDIDTETGRHIFSHELAHISERHSLDKIFMNIVLIICWINPFFWLIRKELNMIHEFIADKKAVGQHDTAVLASMIIQTAYPKHHFLITNHFFYSPIKRRLKMLTKYKSTRATYFTRIVALPVLFLLIAAFTFKAKHVIEKKIEKDFIVVIDAGHGGRDGGARGADGTYEKDLNLALAKKVRELNTTDRIKIILTRGTDVYQSPQEKALIANNLKADLLISIHTSNTQKKYYDVTSGMEVYVARDSFQNSAESKILASAVIGAFDRNYKLKIHPNPIQGKSGIWILQASKCPTVLIEAGYLSNTRDREYLKSKEGMETFSQNVLEAIHNYLAQPLATNRPGMPVSMAKVLGLSSNQFITTNGNGDTIPESAKAMLGLKGKGGETILENVNMIVNTDGKPGELQQSLIVINGQQYDSKFLENKRITAKRVTLYAGNHKKMQSLYGNRAINGVAVFEGADIHTLPGGKFDVAIGNAKTSMNIDASQRLNEKNVKLGELKETLTTNSIRLKGLVDSVNQPLYLLDGKIMSQALLNSLDPNTISSINILKGYSAETQFGSQAQHGAIIILTKKLKESEGTPQKIKPDINRPDPEITLSGFSSSRVPTSRLKDIVDVRTNASNYKFISATIYFVGAGFPQVMVSAQNGGSLSGNALFKRIKAGTTITFDNIVVEDAEGKRMVLPGKAFTFFDKEAASEHH